MNWVNRCPDCRGKVVQAFSAHTGNLILLDDTHGTYALVKGEKLSVAIPTRSYLTHRCPTQLSEAPAAAFGRRATTGSQDEDHQERRHR